MALHIQRSICSFRTLATQRNANLFRTVSTKVMSRLKLWGILLVSSVVTLVSLVQVYDDRDGGNDGVGWKRHEKWLLSVTSISIGLSFFGALTTFLPPAKSLALERPLITLSLTMWASGMPALLDPDNELAVGRLFTVFNANLYFFGWGALVSSICLAGDALREYNGDEASPYSLKWFLLVAASFVVMATSSSLYREVDCQQYGDTSDFDTFCTRTNYAIYSALASAILGMLMVIPFKKAGHMCHFLVALLYLAGWCCGIAFLTFGDAPGSTLGNVYFATWIAFFLSLNLATTSLRYVTGKDKDGDDNEDEEGEKKESARSIGKDEGDGADEADESEDLESGKKK